MGFLALVAGVGGDSGEQVAVTVAFWLLGGSPFPCVLGEDEDEDDEERDADDYGEDDSGGNGRIRKARGGFSGVGGPR